MAFELPLEADRVDERGLFATFIGRPVISTIQWIAGTDRTKGQDEIGEEDELQRSLEAIHAIMDEVEEDLTNTPKASNSSVGHPPRLVRSEVSGVGDCTSALGNLQLPDDEALDPCRQQTHAFKKRKKELSWSDESGQELVKYVDESARHEPRPDMEPSRSALTRSRSIRANADAADEPSGPPKFLPKGFSRRQQNGIIMPTMPYNTNADLAMPSGVDSPQWGWYINTTPPTPEMYYSRPPHKKHESASESSLDSTASATAASQQPNRIFQSLQDKNKTTPMGWPSVPL